MPTNEERREVAAKLRKADDACEFLYALGLKCDIDCEDCSSHVFTRKVCGVLADLIEPEPERTCRVTESSYDELLDEVYTDLSCGHWTRLSEREVSYCPKCGAKIERTDDAD